MNVAIKHNNFGEKKKKFWSDCVILKINKIYETV